MGVYIYRITSPRKQFTAAFNDQPITVACTKYLYKPHWGHCPEDEKIENRALGVINRMWGTDRPEYVINGEKPEIGMGVYKGHAIDLVIDDNFFLTRNCIGILTKKTGNRWCIAPRPTEESYSF